MRTPTRILRSEARNLNPARAELTEKQRARRQTILKLAETLLANHGRNTITLTSLAGALEISAATLRRYFVDLDALLGEILRNHLLALSRAIGDIPFDAPDRHARCRAAYHAFTHTGYGALTSAHLLLTRDTHLLPDDERIPIEQTHQGFGTILAPICPEEALLLLDSPTLTLARIEAFLAPRLAQPATQAKKPTLAPPVPEPHPDFPPEETEGKPGAWIYTAGIPLKSRSPPHS